MKHKISFYIMIFLIIISLFNVYYISQAKANSREIYVDTNYFGSSNGSAEKPYRTIQEAIDGASEGDTIYIFGGFYQENLIIDKKLNIIGRIDEIETIVDSKFDNRYVIEITANEVKIEGLTISDSDSKTTSPIGALIFLDSNSNQINNNFIKNITSYGIYITSKSKNNLIYNNNIYNTTRGIYLYSSSTNDITNNEISNCSECGIYVESNSENTRLYGNSIKNNTIGINIQNCGNVNVTNNTLSNNNIYAISLYNSEEIFLENNNFFNNTGDGVYLKAPSCILSNNLFKFNRRGITLASSNSIIKNNRIYNSSATGIYAEYNSKNNKIYLNDFNGNAISASELGSNVWYYENQGNYWDDYGYIDRDLNGIGDRSYTTNDVSDIYPLGYFLKPPNKPYNPSPKDYATGVTLRIKLSVHIEDFDSDELTVYFYKADGTLIDSKTPNPVRRVSNNSNANCSFTLAFNTTYAWYVVVNDSLLENKSGPYIFYTAETPPNNKRPIANAGGLYYAETNQIIQLNSTGSSDPDGKIDFYRWNFGDNSTEIIKENPIHNYSKAGTYTITLTVIDNNGSSVSDTATVFVTLGENDPPVAIALVPSSGIIAKSINFSSQGTIDPDGDKLSIFWDFGDGTNSTEKNPLHTYQLAGTYNVSLKVSDAQYFDIESYYITIKKADEGIPGFELILIIIALLTILFLKKKLI